MGVVVRIPKRMFKEIKKLQTELTRQRGEFVSFQTACSEYRKKLKRYGKWKFPEFS